MRRQLRALLALALAALIIVAAAPTDGDRDGDGLSDSFEARWGLTDPGSADTNGDGISDGAEDQDGDGLSALGEQRFGTNPGNPDSDDDGVPDGQDDSNGDGQPDELTQDQRPVPKSLHPAPDKAWWDRPAAYDQGCHGDVNDPALHPCWAGDPNADRVVVLFGDSHALQWFPALDQAAITQGWQLVNLTKSACPAAEVVFQRGPGNEGADASCLRWRQRVIDWLAERQPEAVILSSASRFYRDRLVDNRGNQLPGAQREAAWQRGQVTTLEALPEESTAVVIADTPQLRRNPASCLPNHPRDISACETRRADAIDAKHDQAEGVAAEAGGALFVDLNDKVCPYDPCPVVMDDVMMWRNEAHITATFAARLAPSMVSLLEQISQMRGLPAA